MLVAWFPATGADRLGRDKIHAPVEVPVRWERNSNLRVSDFLLGRNVTDEVMTPTELPVGAIVWKGQLKDLEGVEAPTPLFRVEGNSSIPDIKGLEFDYSAFLSPFHEVLPSVV